MKVFFVCDGSGDWWSCHGVLSNGFYFAQHLCSHPGFAPGDLLYTRSERLSALKELFGVTKETESETVVVRNKNEIPAFWDALVTNEDVQRDLATFYERYKKMLGGEIPKSGIEITFSE